MRALWPVLAVLSVSGASAAPVDVGVSLGLPRAGITPVDVSVTAPLLTAGDLSVWGRADVTFGLGTRLTPAVGATLVAQPSEAYGASRPFLGVGATTISSFSGTQVRPVILAGVQTRRGNLGGRLDGAMVLTDDGPRFNAAIGLLYRFAVGGTK